MINCYTPDSRLQLRMAVLLGTAIRVRWAEEWRNLERNGPGAEVSLVAVERLAGSALYPQLREFTRRLPAYPLVLITARDAENARVLRQIAVEEVVWLPEMERELLPAIRRASAQRPLLRLAGEAEGAEHLPLLLRRAVALACRQNPPFRSITDLAGALGRDRRTLSTAWRQALGADSRARLEDLVDWILLLRAAARWAVGWKTSAVAQELSVHEQTLSRIARRLAGSSPTQIRTAGRHGLILTLRERVVVLLLGEGAWDVLQ